MQERKFKFVGDRQNATYRAELYLENGKVLDGYSKHTNHDEPIDKEKCLVGYVGRIIANGYLSKCQYIAFYTNHKLGKHQDETLIELHCSGYKLGGIAETMFDLKNYLQQVYKNIHAGKQFTDVKPLTAKSFSPDLFKISGQFATQADLDKYCESLKTKGVPYGRVQGFYYAYLKAYPFTGGGSANGGVNIENLIGSQFSHMINR